MFYKSVKLDGTCSTSVPIVTNDSVKIPVADIQPGTGWIDLHIDGFEAQTGEDGYFLIPTVHEQNRPSGLVRFQERTDLEECYRYNDMPVFGVKHGNSAILAVVSGMSLSYSIVFGVKNGRYYIYPRFHLNGGEPFEAPEVKLFELSGQDADFCGMARRYRQYQLERGSCIPLKTRQKEFPLLKELTPALTIRIRHAWKPCPAQVLEQTTENEPNITTAVTFDRAGEILDECNRQGLKKAEFCLVGWNKSGHDGRFPDLFPAEPLLGGDEALQRLIEKARNYGYYISCHTNVLDSYTISERLNRSDFLIGADGNPVKGGCWSGGQSYFLCPEMAHKHYVEEDMDTLREMGFCGTHYFDVMSMINPVPCYSPDHPLNSKEAGKWRGRSLALAREKIGASGSEGGLDFCIGDLDYVLYALYELEPNCSSLVDQFVPFWFIVYHGIVTYNSATMCVNAMVKKDPASQLKNIELGGRPTGYFYSKFLSDGSSWMGNEDLMCSTDEQLHYGVKKLVEAEKLYDTLSDLQYEFLEEHRNLTDQVILTRYSCGSEIVVNYGDCAYSYQGREVPAQGFLRF